MYKTIYLLFVPFFAFADFEIIPNGVASSNITTRSVSLSATLYSNGSLSGNIFLWYGEGDTLSDFQSISFGVFQNVTFDGVTIGGSLSGLSPNTLYSFKWILVNSTNQIVYNSETTSFVTKSNSPPTDIAISSSEISEDAEVGSIVGSLSTSDIDSGDQFTYSLVSGDGDSGNSNFSIDGNNLLSASTFDAETIPSYYIRIQTDDGNGGVFSKSFNISITTGDDSSDNSLPIYVPTNGLVAYYPFNGGADDASANANNGSVNGAILSEDRNGNPNSCYYFDGQDDYIDMGSDESLKIQNSFSTSVWFKATGGRCNPRIFEYYNNSSYGGGYALAITTGTQLHVVYFGAKNEENGFDNIDNFFNQNTWNHIAFTVDGATGQAKLYLNGELLLDRQNNIQTQQINYSGSLHVGNINPFRCDWFEGNIDDLGLWNRTLTQQEVTNLFNSETSLSTTDFSYNSITIYPNPVNNMITIDGLDVQDVVIYSVHGKAVFKISNQNTIDISSLSKGVYFIKVSDGINASTKKFIKE